jgi:hypothetical protein
MQIQAGCPTPGTPAACEHEITSRNSTMSKDQMESTECFHFCPLDRRIDFLQIIVQNISREESRTVIFHLPEQLSRKSSRIIKLLFIAQAEIFCSPTHQKVTSTYSDDSYVFGCYTVSTGKTAANVSCYLEHKNFCYWRRRHYYPSKRLELFSAQHGVTSYKIWLFSAATAKT